MANGIRTGDPLGFNKGRSLKFHLSSRVWQTPEEGQRTYWLKHCGNNNKDEDNSLKTLNDKNHQASSQKFRQLTPTTMILPTKAGTFNCLSCFGHVIYMLQTSTYQNIAKFHLCIYISLLNSFRYLYCSHLHRYIYIPATVLCGLLQLSFVVVSNLWGISNQTLY